LGFDLLIEGGDAIWDDFRCGRIHQGMIVVYRKESKMEDAKKKTVEERTLGVKEIDMTGLTDVLTAMRKINGCGLWNGNCWGPPGPGLGCGLWNGRCHATHATKS
jgi:hypothetical protein